MAMIRKARHDEVPPLINENCDTLVLGSMLSPKSAEKKFYYAHPQNRFWRVMSAVFDEPMPKDFDECAKLALDNGIALWDVISSCDIIGARDDTIKNVTYCDIDGLLKKYRNITRIYATGGKAFELLQKYNAGIHNPMISDAVRLPSTSTQNRNSTLQMLIDAYSVIKRKKE